LIYSLYNAQRKKKKKKEVSCSFLLPLKGKVRLSRREKRKEEGGITGFILPAGEKKKKSQTISRILAEEENRSWGKEKGKAMRLGQRKKKEKRGAGSVGHLDVNWWPREEREKGRSDPGADRRRRANWKDSRNRGSEDILLDVGKRENKKKGEPRPATVYARS